MATPPNIVVLPTVDGVQIDGGSGASVILLGTGVNTALVSGESTGLLSSVATFELNGLIEGQEIGVDWGTPPGFPPAGTSLTNTAVQAVLVLRPK